MSATVALHHLCELYPINPFGQQLPPLFDQALLPDMLFPKGNLQAFTMRQKILRSQGLDDKANESTVLRALQQALRHPQDREMLYWIDAPGHLGFSNFLSSRIAANFGREAHRFLKFNLDFFQPDEAFPALTSEPAPTQLKAQLWRALGQFLILCEYPHPEVFRFFSCNPADAAIFHKFILPPELAGNASILIDAFQDHDFPIFRRGIHNLAKCAHGIIAGEQLRKHQQILEDAFAAEANRHRTAANLKDLVDREIANPERLRELFLASLKPQDDWLARAQAAFSDLPAFSTPKELEALLSPRIATLEQYAWAEDCSRQNARQIARLNQLRPTIPSPHVEAVCTAVKTLIPRTISDDGNLYLIHPHSNLANFLKTLIAGINQPLAPDELEQGPALGILCAHLGLLTTAPIEIPQITSANSKTDNCRCDSAQQQDADLKAAHQLELARQTQDHQTEISVFKERTLRLKTQLQEREKEITSLRRQLDAVSKIKLPAAPKSGSPPVFTGTNVYDAVTTAQAAFPRQLVFLPEALEAAELSPYRQADEVFRYLAGMAELADIWLAKKGSLGTHLKAAFLGVELPDYRAQISQSASERFASDYTFTWNGVSQIFGEHFTIGSKNANTCLSIHFLSDSKNQRFIIGHVGRHLENSLS